MYINRTVRRFLKILLYTILLCTIHQTSAQVHQFRNFDLRHGLMNSEIRTISSDGMGFIYVGTGNGAYRFNGQNFELIQTSNKKIRNISFELNQVLIGTEGGLTTIDSKGQSESYLKRQHVVKSLSYGNDLYVITQDGVYKQSADTLERIHSTFSKQFVDAIVYDSSIWIATEENGIEILEFRKGEWLSSNMDPSIMQEAPASVRGFAINDDGELWLVSTDKGVQYFENGLFYSISYSELDSYLFSSICYDQHSRSFWLGTWGQGIVNLTRTQFATYSEKNGLADNVIRCIYPVGNGMIVSGSMTHGISIYAPSGVSYYNQSTGLPDNNVSSIVKLNDKIVASTLKGISSIDAIDIDTLLQGVKCGPIIKVNNEHVIVGTSDGQLHAVSANETTLLNPAQNLGASVTALHKSGDRIFVGTYGKGLFLMDEQNNLIPLTNADDMKIIRTIYKQNDIVLMGTDEGVWQYDLNSKELSKFLPNDDKINESRINQIGGEYGSDGILIATESQGIALYKPEENKQILWMFKGETVRSFQYVKTDLFLTTNISLYQVQFSSSGSTITHIFNVTEVDSKEINPNALLISKDQVLIGTGFGLVTYNQANSHISQHTRSLNIFLDKILVDDVPTSITEKNLLSLPSKTKKVELSFKHLNLNTDNYIIQYKINDEDWLAAPKDNVIRLKNLSAGTYKITYRLIDDYGQYSPSRTITFKIESPYWQNWKFLSMIMLGALVFFGVLLFFFRPRRKSINNQVHLKQTIFTSRLIIIFGAISYPLIGYLDTLVDPNIVNQQLEVAIGIGAVLLIAVSASFSSLGVMRVLPQMVIIGYLTIFSHLIIVIYINSIVASHVVGLILLISVSSVVFNSLKHMLVFGLFVLACVLYLTFNVANPFYTPTQFIVTSMSAVLISILLITVRLNIFHRMEISDTVVNNVDALVIVSSKKGEILHIGESIHKELGYYPREVKRELFWETFGEDIRPHFQSQSSSDHENTRITFPLKSKTGGQKFYRWLKTNLPNGNIINIGYDVSYQQNLEEELNRLSLVARHTDAGTIMTDAENRILWVNSSFEKISGYTLNEIKGLRPADFMSGELTDQKAVEESRSEKSRNEGYRTEILNYTKYGEKIWLSVVSTPIKDENGKVTQIIEVIQDITNKKERELELEQLSLVASNTDNYVIITNAKDEALWVNEAFTEIFGFEFQDIKGKKLSDFLSTEKLNPDEISHIRHAVFDNKQKYVGEFCDKTKNENIIWVSASVMPVLNDDNDIQYILSVGSDITDKKLKEFELNQVSKANHLMHAIDSVLISKLSDEGINKRVLELIMKSNPEFYASAFIEINKDSSAEIILHIASKNSEKAGMENIRELSEFEKIREGNIVVIDQLMDLDDLSYMDKIFMFNGCRSAIYVPIMFDDKLYGIIALGAHMPAYFSDNELDTFSNISNSISIILKQRAQRQLVVESEENFRQLNESISEAFWLSNTVSGELIYVNKMFEKMFGYPIDKLIENPLMWTDNIHPEDKERVVSAFKEKAFVGSFNEEYRIVVDGHNRWIHSIAYPIHNDEGEVIKLSGTSRDITEAKLTETAINKLNDQLKSVNILNQTVLNNGDLGNELYAIVEKLFAGKTIKRLNITIYDFENDIVKFHFIQDNNIRIYDNKEFPLDSISTVNLHKLSKGEFVLVGDINEQEVISDSDKKMLDNGINAYMMYPLIHNNALLGSLNLSFYEKFELDFDRVKFLKMLAEGISISIYQKLLQEEIERDRKKLEEYNKDISDSISYAKKFQTARLPEISDLTEQFSSADVIYLPRDIVSGDFYWTGRVNDTLLFAAGDCTGHGVPGAFMTLLFNFLLDKIVLEQSQTEPARILELLDSGIKDYFAASAEESDAQIQDGMDIALAKYNLKDQSLTYSGARRPLFIYRKASQTVDIVAGSKISIGESNESGFGFNTEHIQYEKGDIIYLFSDGFVDQFGGPDNRKYGKRRLFNLLENIGHKNAHVQKGIILQEFIDWQADQDQIDDVVMLIIEL